MKTLIVFLIVLLNLCVYSQVKNPPLIKLNNAENFQDMAVKQLTQENQQLIELGAGFSTGIMNSAATSGNIAYISQVGDFNSASIGQFGSSNTAVIEQNGDNNSASVNQMGNNNFGRIYQNGDENSWDINQDGNKSEIHGEQIGNNNNIMQRFSGDKLKFAASQVGSNHELIQIENDRNVKEYSIFQRGEGMKLIIIYGAVNR